MIREIDAEPQKEVIKLLMIGNSFSVDATTFLFDIAKSAGIQVVIGNVYASGTGFEGHWNKVQNREGVTAYEKYTLEEGKTSKPDALLVDSVLDEEWDFITYQQNSINSGSYCTFQPYLNDIHHLVQSIAPHNTRYGFHLTWAYADGSSAYGDGSQKDMFYAIVNAYQQAMQAMNFDILLPVGTAIQNARSNKYLNGIGEALTRDKSHLNEEVGRYIAAMTVFETLFACHYNKDSIMDVSFYPTGVTPFLGYLSKLAAKNAALNPFQITPI